MNMLEFVVFSVFASITLAPTNIVYSAVKSDKNEAADPSTSSSNPHYFANYLTHLIVSDFIRKSM